MRKILSLLLPVSSSLQRITALHYIPFRKENLSVYISISQFFLPLFFSLYITYWINIIAVCVCVF